MKTQSVMGSGVGRGWRWGWLLAPLALAACGGGMTPEEPRAEEVTAVHEAAAHEGARLAPRWLRTQGGRGLELSDKLAMDASGNAITSFSYEGPADASGKPLPWNGNANDRHLGIVKYRPDGSVAWVRGFAPDPTPDSYHSMQAQALTVDPRGDVLIGGLARTGATLDGKSVWGTFLAKLDRDTGRVLWARSARPAPDTEFTFQDFEADAQGNFVALASFTRFVDGAATTPEVMLIKYRGSDSEPLWDRLWPQPEGGYVGAAEVSVDGAGNIYLGGSFDGRVDFGGEPKLQTTPNAEGWQRSAGFILALTPSGAFRWNRQVTGGEWGGTLVTSLSASQSRVLVMATGEVGFQGTYQGAGTFVMGFYSEDGGERWVQRVSSNYQGGLVRAVGEEAVVMAHGDASLFGNPRTRPTSQPYMTEYQTFFVAKFWRTSGRYLGSRNVEQVTPEIRDLGVTDLAMSPVDGEVLVNGLYGGETDFGTGATVTPRGIIDTFLLRLKH